MTRPDSPAAEARPGDLVVAEQPTGDTPGEHSMFEVGVVSHTDADGWVIAFRTTGGCTKPVAFISGHERSALLLVPRDRIDIAAAVETARQHGPFQSLDEVRAVTRPLLNAHREAEIEAGS